MPRQSKGQLEWTDEAWTSLLELLSPSDFFITVDSFSLWRRHLAWAKPDGKELRDILTMRFSSTMVLLSLLLVTEMGILFNPNEVSRGMRDAMAAEAYGDFKFWIGITVWISACVTVIGLVGTFAAWGMVSSISAENAHCLLRSSIGQYVASQPAHFVTAALYLFLSWLIMFLVEMLHGPSRIALVAMIAYLFFQVIVPLSAFGRLIVHTGAMSSKRIIDPEFEKCLLPSGLQASLLIKGTQRKRKRVSVLSQYRTVSIAREQRQSSVEAAVNSKTANYGSLGSSTPAESTLSDGQRESLESSLPRASVLNCIHTSNLRAVVERVLAPKPLKSGSFGEDVEFPDEAEQSEGEETLLEEPSDPKDEWLPLRQPSDGLLSRSSVARPTLSAEQRALSAIEERASVVSSVVDTLMDPTSDRPPVDSTRKNSTGLPSEVSPANVTSRVSRLGESMSMLIRGHMRRATRIQIENEWFEENDVREMYDLPPPAMPEDDDDDNEVENQFNSLYSSVSLLNAPRLSLWTRNRRSEVDPPRSLLTGKIEPSGESEHLLSEKKNQPLSTV